MNRIVQRFRELGARHRAALIVYLTAGDPSLEETAALAMEAAAAGADILELGVPWSDPSADGPVIQRAMERALTTGGAGRDTLGKTLDVVRKIREHTDVPIVLFGYYNPLLQRGIARAVDEAAQAGVDGMLIVDLPPEESVEMDAALASAGLVRVPLLAPTTSVERARTIVARGGGFAYYVALTGVTGAGHLDIHEVTRRTRELRPALGGLPLAVGFGIRDAAGARAIADVADAVVVGSALVQAIADAPDANGRRGATR
ncbi:MAG TPA: tryptophan synthase subunit alpha, partial [Kofleriaceae bacterium]|nr:tryptophan synthase subunit alpha [Kofleriaceae bacterium]